MSVTLLCPACGRPVTLRVEVDEASCPHCAATIPAPLLNAGAAEIRGRKPALIRLLTLFLGAWAIIAVLTSLMMVFGGASTYTFNGERVARDEFMGMMRPVFAMLALLVPAVGATVWALYREKPWGRHAVMGLICAITGAPVVLGVGKPMVSSMRVPMIIGAVAHAVPAFWYFYRKRNVVAYYRSLQARG
ncbi:hypothetical protein [Longimicrobium terrae]|uniref:Uncharacterized protein n=1 Tax=Longimicrobium terrae TaxID=1639882 RepID=A0A841H0G0_9BACT|nr:hypothetical protein [Longimicrobium terrae]MBB4637245.1 hypothetical protein [Longimicrobium terrae]MBB6071493.1 hypothetical protein [Longimicrobium terrae]NNC30084.1 hypothetical protein [Longimicrobium terrae]